MGRLLKICPLSLSLFLSCYDTCGQNWRFGHGKNGGGVPDTQARGKKRKSQRTNRKPLLLFRLNLGGSRRRGGRGSSWASGGVPLLNRCDAKARMPKSSGIGRNVRTLLGLSGSIPVPGNRDAFQGGAQLLSATLRVLRPRSGYVSRIHSGGSSAWRTTRHPLAFLLFIYR